MASLYTKWIKKGDNTFIPTDNSVIQPQLDSGLYDLRYSPDIGFFMIKRKLYLDELLEFPSNIHSQVLSTIKDFWSREEKFREYGFAFKRGVLLHGKPGSGKTCVLNLALKYCITDLKGVVISLSTDTDLNLFRIYIPEILRAIEPKRPLIVTIEDIEGFCKYSETETALLNVLDGIDQLENTVYLATTNYIEDLKERIINRPSRFDRRIYVPFLNYEDRMFFFKNKLKESDLKNIDLHRWSTDTEGMSIAHLAELIKSVIISGLSYEEALEIMKEMQDFTSLHSTKYEKQTKRVGFTQQNKNAYEKKGVPVIEELSEILRSTTSDSKS